MISDEDVSRLRRLMEAREKRDTTKTAASEAEKEYREIEAEIHESLSEGPVDRLNNVDLGPPYGKVSFHAKTTTYGRVINAERAQEYFEERAMIDEMMTPKFAEARINEIVREHDDRDAPMPPGLDFYKRRYIQITKQK